MVEQPQPDQGLATRDRILATATRLFSARGYEHTPLSQVAREANVSKALVLWHFDSKEALFRAALGRTLEPYHLDLDDLVGLDENAQIELLMDRFYEFVRDNVYSVRFLFGLLIRGEQKRDDVIARVGDLYDLFRDVLADIIARGRDRGRFRGDASPRLDASLILASLGGLVIEQLLRDQVESDDILAHVKQTVVRRLIA
ncbi:MAG: TetR/AcrR family transcriptional regulator [Candidatus Binatia bacterium]